MSAGVLSVREQLRFVREAMLSQGAALAGAPRGAADSVLARGDAPPDSRFAREALELASEVYGRPLLGHCLRCWLWADLFAQIDSLTPDPELLYVSCLLHDIALTPGFDPPPGAGCFAVHGGEAARGLLSDKPELAGDTARVIALHMNVHVPATLGVEAHLLHAAAHLDVAGTRANELPSGQRLAVLRRHPRDGFRSDFAARMRREARMRPRSRAALSWRLGMRVPMALNPLERDARQGGALLPAPCGQRLDLGRGLSAVATPSVDDRPPVLLLHGMMGGAWQFDNFQRALTEAGYGSLALDYRGHHHSEMSGRLGRVSVRDYVDDAVLACRSLGRPPIVIGQSMGGLVAQMLAAREDLAAAVLVCSLPPRGVRWRGARDQRFAWRHGPAVVAGRPISPDRAELDDLILNGFDHEEGTLHFVRQVPESSRAGVEIAFGLVGVPADAVRCPLLSVTAGADRLVFPDVGAQLAARYGGEQLHFADRAHYALVGEPGWEEVAAGIIEWMGHVS